MPNSEMISYTTAQLSIGIDSEDLQCLPRFLADVNKAPCTKEWFISPSTLDEVFIKVIQDNRDVAEANKILQEQEAKQIPCGEILLMVFVLGLVWLFCL